MCKILIIDDEILYDTSFLLSLTHKYGFDVISASSAQDGISQIKKNPDISAIILDIMMPILPDFTDLERNNSDNGLSTGIQLVPRIDQILPEVPILVVTARKDIDIDTFKNIRVKNIKVLKKQVKTSVIAKTLNDMISYEN